MPWLAASCPRAPYNIKYEEFSTSSMAVNIGHPLHRNESILIFTSTEYFRVQITATGRKKKNLQE